MIDTFRMLNRFRKKSLILILFSVIIGHVVSCYNITQESYEDISGDRNIISVTKFTGDFIEFPKGNPARIRDNRIVWKREMFGEKVIIQGVEEDIESLSIPLYEVDQIQTRRIDTEFLYPLLAMLGLFAIVMTVYLTGLINT
jgi:hypothetical protein